MRRILALCFLFTSCSMAQSETDLRAEYDSIVNHQARLEKRIALSREMVTRISAYSSQESKESLPLFQSDVDSCTMVKEKLEKRRKELAKQLFN